MYELGERPGDGGHEVSEDREPTAAEMLAWRHDDVFLPEAEASPEEFPHLQNISAEFIFGGVVRSLEPAPPEYVTLSTPHTSDQQPTRPAARQCHPCRRTPPRTKRCRSALVWLPGNAADARPYRDRSHHR